MFVCLEIHLLLLVAENLSDHFVILAVIIIWASHLKIDQF